MQEQSATAVVVLMEFGEKLRVLRREQGLTQAEVAEMIGISRRAYVSYEQQGARPRKREIYEKLASTLGCDINDLLMEDSRSYDNLRSSARKIGGAAAGGMLAGTSAVAMLGIAASPFGLFLAPALLVASAAAFSERRKKGVVTQAAPITSAREAIQSFERVQKRFLATSMGLIYGRLAELGIPFHPDTEVSIDESMSGPDVILGVKAPGIDSWWLCFWAAGSEPDDSAEVPASAVAKALLSRFLCYSPNPRKKASIVIDSPAIYDALLRLKGSNSYKGNLTAVLVDTSEFCLLREESIASFEEERGEGEPFLVV